MYSGKSDISYPGKKVIEYIIYCEINDALVMQFKAYDFFPYNKDFHPEDSLEINFYSLKKNYPNFNIKNLNFASENKN